jgi:hypothetical protein
MWANIEQLGQMRTLGQQVRNMYLFYWLFLSHLEIANQDEKDTVFLLFWLL